jgi:hypothetical protein
MARKASGTSSDMDNDMNRGMSTSRNVSGETPTSNPMRSRDIAGRRTIVGVFQDRDDAERAIGDLKDAGFTGDQIGIAMRDRNAQGQLIEDTGTHAAEGAVTGAVGGGILGGLAGLLVGIGALAIPGIGPVVAGGALATAFGTAAGTAVAGAGIGAAAGGIVGALVGMGVPEEEARYFESGFRTGGVLVSVNAENRAMEAMNILEHNGADTGSNMGDTGTLHDSGMTTGTTGTTDTARSGSARRRGARSDDTERSM